MTVLDITLHYLAPVGPRQLRAMYRVREVYGIRRLHPEDMRVLLRSAGLDTDGVAEGVFDAG